MSVETTNTKYDDSQLSLYVQVGSQLKIKANRK